METKIEILSLEEAIDKVEKGPTDYNIVSLRDGGKCVYEIFDTYRNNYEDIIAEYFDDVEHQIAGEQLAKKEQIEKILKWAKDKNNLIVHCTAGVSRSSATAYLIVCMKEGIDEGLSILDYKLHSPNRWVIYLGSKILGDEKIFSKFNEWYALQKDKLQIYLNGG